MGEGEAEKIGGEESREKCIVQYKQFKKRRQPRIHCGLQLSLS